MTRRLTHRFQRFRIVRSAAYRLGQALAGRQRVLAGQLATGSPIVLTSGDPAHRHIFFYGTYEPEVTAVFQARVRPGDTVIDVGANAGYFALLSRDLGAEVHAFEPNPAMAALIRRSLDLRGGRVTVVESACSSREGVLPLYLGEGGNMATSSLNPGLNARDTASIDVAVTTLDAYVERTRIDPSLVKVDVERHEADFVKGAMRTLATLRPDLVIEMTDGEALEALLSIGYRAHRITSRGLVPTTGLGPEGWANMLLTAGSPVARRRGTEGQDQSGRNSSS